MINEFDRRRSMCKECMSDICVFNPEGICMFPIMYGRKPFLSDDGCKDCVLKSEENDSQSPKMIKYTITFTLNGYFRTEVEAENVEDAVKIASDAFCEANFGEAFNIDGKLDCIEDENGNEAYF